MREMSPKEYDELTKQLENDTFMFVGHKKNTLVYFGCKPMIKRGNQYLKDNIPGARIVTVVITDQLDNKKNSRNSSTQKRIKISTSDVGSFWRINRFNYNFKLKLYTGASNIFL